MSPTSLFYIDAGTGSMLLQLLLGGVAAATVTAKLYWGRVRSLFRPGDADDESPT